MLDSFSPYVVPAGATLTVAAGQVVKARFSQITVAGRLISNGTLDRPVVFTSLFDDSAGGDTDNGGASTGRRGQWTGLEFTPTSAGSSINYTEVRFGFGVQHDAQIFVDDTDLTVRNSVSRSCDSSGIYSRGNATVVVENSLIFDNSFSLNFQAAGIHADGGVLTVANSTIDGNDRGIVADGALATLVNNLITFNTRSGVTLRNGATLDARFNDVFNPGALNANYEGIADPSGSGGNVSVDPKYFNRANFQYQLRGGSPAIDAGTSDATPATDFLGNPRFDDPNVVNRGGGAMPFVDLGAFERQQSSGLSNIDLAATQVSGPAAGIPDETVTVRWTVANLGAGTALGPWSDAVYLSDDAVWDPGDRLLGRLTHTSDLGPGLNYSEMLDVPLRTDRPGRHYFVVRTNDRNHVFEAESTANNAGVSASAVELGIQSLVLNVPLADQFTAVGQSRFYELEVPIGQTLTVELDSAATSGATELYARRNRLPSRDEFDFRSAGDLLPDQRLTVPTTGPGTYYVLAYAGSGLAGTSDFTITASVAGFGIDSFYPNYASATPVTMRINGTGLTRDVQVELVGKAPFTDVIPAAKAL